MSKKKKDCSKCIVIEEYIPVMYCKVKIVIGEWKHAKKYIQKKFHRDFKGQNYAARCSFFYGNDSCASEAVIHSKYAKLPVITHEIVHICNYMFDSIGCIPSFTNDEVQAHLIQYLVEILDNKLREFENGTKIAKKS